MSSKASRKLSKAGDSRQRLGRRFFLLPPRVVGSVRSEGTAVADHPWGSVEQAGRSSRSGDAQLRTIGARPVLSRTVLTPIIGASSSESDREAESRADTAFAVELHRGDTAHLLHRRSPIECRADERIRDIRLRERERS